MPDETPEPQIESKLVYPGYFRVVRREPGVWHFRKSSVFWNPKNLPGPSDDDRENYYGTTKGKVAIELFRINGGKSGWYLVNLRDKLYYYCGPDREDVRAKLLELGIGRPDPMDSVE